MHDLSSIHAIASRMPALGTTLKDAVFRDGPATLYRFRPATGVAPASSAPVLLVPSLINRWYVLDLLPGHSVAEALTEAGLDVWLLDWGTWGDEDRYFGWDDLLTRLSRMARRVRRETKEPKLTLLGYSMGSVLAGVFSALEPDTVAGFVNLMGPFDFTHAGHLKLIADEAWFDADAVSDAGNIHPFQVQGGFQMLRPPAKLARLVAMAEPGLDPKVREALHALEAWVGDHVAFPAEAYRRYIKEMYQQNQLYRGVHRVAGRPVNLKDITCPVLTVCSEKDDICPPEAAKGLNRAVGSSEQSVLQVPGGHVASVVGGKAAALLYPKLVHFMKGRPCSSKT